MCVLSLFTTPRIHIPSAFCNAYDSIQDIIIYVILFSKGSYALPISYDETYENDTENNYILKKKEEEEKWNFLSYFNLTLILQIYYERKKIFMKI